MVIFMQGFAGLLIIRSKHGKHRFRDRRNEWHWKQNMLESEELLMSFSDNNPRSNMTRNVELVICTVNDWLGIFVCSEHNKICHISHLHQNSCLHTYVLVRMNTLTLNLQISSSTWFSSPQRYFSVLGLEFIISVVKGCWIEQLGEILGVGSVTVHNKFHSCILWLWNRKARLPVPPTRPTVT